MISAALIIADKTDVRRSRVRPKSNPLLIFMIASIMQLQIQNLRSQKISRLLHSNLQIDENICSMYDYFEIFLERMMLCRKSAEVLGTTFKLTVNGRKSFINTVDKNGRL